MQVTIELMGMFSYSLILIIFILIMLIITFFLMIKKDKKKDLPEVIIPTKKDLAIIKNKYLEKINELSNKLASNKISSRKAYQELSSLVRNFVYEVTNVKFQNYTLRDIKLLNMSQLVLLVSDYYDPEFSKISKGNISESINKTKEVISKWK